MGSVINLMQELYEFVFGVHCINIQKTVVNDWFSSDVKKINDKIKFRWLIIKIRNFHFINKFFNYESETFQQNEPFLTSSRTLQQTAKVDEPERTCNHSLSGITQPMLPFSLYQLSSAIHHEFSLQEDLIRNFIEKIPQ